MTLVDDMGDDVGTRRLFDDIDARVARWPRQTDPEYIWVMGSYGKLPDAAIRGYGDVRYDDMKQLFESINGINAHSEHWAYRAVPDDVQ